MPVALRWARRRRIGPRAGRDRPRPAARTPSGVKWPTGRPVPPYLGGQLGLAGLGVAEHRRPLGLGGAPNADGLLLGTAARLGDLGRKPLALAAVVAYVLDQARALVAQPVEDLFRLLLDRL